MESQEKVSGEYRIHKDTHLSQIGLTVTDLQRSVLFYSEFIGLTVHEQDSSSAVLGAPDNRFLALTEKAGGTPWPRGGRSHPGLYHLAILVPTRADLGRWLAHWLQQELPPPGQGDHLVSEALYLEDPDGHGIEIYRDRPRDEWEWNNGQVRMTTDPVDVRGLLAEAQRSADPWTNMPVGTTLGHVHLQVRDIEETAQFYDNVLGFDIVANMPSALFMSAGGYHHHIGANIWHSRNADPAPEDSVKLEYFTVALPDENERSTLFQRLEAAGYHVKQEADYVAAIDPSGIEVRLVV